MRLVAAQARAFQHIETAQYIDLEIGAWIGHRGRHRHLRGEMRDGLDFGDQPLAKCGIDDRALHQLHLVIVALFQPIEILARPWTGKIVEDRHIGTPSERAIDEIAADKARSSGHQQRLGQPSVLIEGVQGARRLS